MGTTREKSSQKCKIDTLALAAHSDAHTNGLTAGWTAAFAGWLAGSLG
ncbi:unnamed protein product, partial [Angiostrongylus costaricensis]|uniref:Lipoprotein n=1 Tax=Angiostrongylus costaricensis TaxID=334426 RepID=A0A0R3PAN5_ANGCS